MEFFQAIANMSGDSLAQHLANGISLGSLYALIAIGYTMVYGIAKMLNLERCTAIGHGMRISTYLHINEGIWGEMDLHTVIFDMAVLSLHLPGRFLCYLLLTSQNTPTIRLLGLDVGSLGVLVLNDKEIEVHLIKDYN